MSTIQLNTKDFASQTSSAEPVIASTVTFPAGHCLQVISSTKSDTSTKTTDSFSTIPGTDQSGSGSVWCAKITPSSTSSKVLVTVIVHVGHIMDSYPAFILYRNAVTLGVADSITSGTEVTFGGRVGGGDNTDADMNIYSYTYLDSPSLTSEITYQLTYSSMRTDTREIHINRSKSVGDANQMGASSTITLMEIAG